MKKKCSKTVTPNITTLESLITQNIQSDKHMNNYQQQTLKRYNATPLWTKTCTRDDIVTIAKIQIQKNYEQQEYYCCKFIKEDDELSIIHMV